MASERRRELVDRIFAAAVERGRPVDDHPLFRVWIEEWVREEIDIEEVKRRYADLKTEQRRERRLKTEERIRRIASAGATISVSTAIVPSVPVITEPRNGTDGPTLEEVLNEMGWKPGDEDEPI